MLIKGKSKLRLYLKMNIQTFIITTDFCHEKVKSFHFATKMFTITNKTTIKTFERSRKATTTTSVCRILLEKTHQLHLILTFQQSCNVHRIVHTHYSYRPWSNLRVILQIRSRQPLAGPRPKTNTAISVGPYYFSTNNSVPFSVYDVIRIC